MLIFNSPCEPVSRCWSWITAGLVTTAIGCTPQNQYVPPPPPKVTVELPVSKAIVDSREYTGTTQAFESVSIRARVEGFLDLIAFEEGNDVKNKQLLFLIDPRPFQAVLDQATAGVELAKARVVRAMAAEASRRAELDNAEAQLRRVETASRQVAGAVTQQEIDEKRTAVSTGRAAVQASVAEVQSTEAEVAVGEAEVAKAQLNLGYTRVESPINGRVGLKTFDVGSFVGRADSTELTTVVRYDPIYAYFTVSEADFLRYNRERLAKEENGAQTGTRPPREDRTVHLALGDDEGYPHAGEIDYLDLVVDESTGTYLVRGIFSNADRLIPPGAFVRVRVPLDEQTVMLVNEQSIGRDQGGAYVLAVNDENVVEMRRVELGSKYEGRQVIRGGDLKPDDRVVVRGVQMARPGATVEPIDEKTAE